MTESNGTTRVWETPVLVVLGDIETLTSGGISGGPETPVGLSGL
jgi:hypothetical protein